MLVLGLETSCDETGVALYDSERGLLADALFSQIDLHRAYGGVVPELASRDHVKRMLPLIRQVLEEAGRTAQDIDAIAIPPAPAWSGPCWWALRAPRRWPLPGRFRPWAYTTWKVICWRQCSRSSRRSFRSSLCWCRAAIPSWCGWMASVVTPCSASRWTMRLARPSTRPPRCSGWSIRVARRLRVWLNVAYQDGWSSRGR